MSAGSSRRSRYYWGAILMLSEWLPIILQTLVIVGAIVVAFMRFIARQAVTESRLGDLRDDHTKLSDKVDGISRAVARIEGSLE